VKKSEVGMPEKEEGVVRKEGHKVNKVSGGPNERRKVQVKSVVVLAKNSPNLPSNFSSNAKLTTYKKGKLFDRTKMRRHKLID
jgi:hypothetical protein